MKIEAHVSYYSFRRAVGISLVIEIGVGQLESDPTDIDSGR